MGSENERIRWTWEDKDIVLDKSRGRCSHCGKVLSRDDMTMDHYIPISRGGSNDLSNLIALCYDCNQDKSDKIVYASQYYRYVKIDELIDLFEIKERFEKKAKWQNTKNFMPEDAVIVRYSSGHNVFRSFRKGGYAVGIPLGVKMEKAEYKDLDEIYNKVKKYHEKMGLYTGGVKESISDIFSKGAIYKIVKGSDIVGVIPISISNKPADNGAREYRFRVSGLPCFYQKDENQDMMFACLKHLFNELSVLHPYGVVSSDIVYPERDGFIYNMFVSHGMFEDNDRPGEVLDGWCCFRANVVFYDDEDDMSDEEWKARKEEILDAYSDFIRKSFGLKNLDTKKVSDAVKKNRKKARKREYDEYDPEFYAQG